MRYLKKLPSVPVVAALLLCGATTALGATKVSISSDGKGIFTVKGADFYGVAGAKITIAYDAATLGNPRVTQGTLVSDAMMATNTSVPGTVTLALLQAKGVTGTGDVATITFDLRGTSPGVIQSQTVDLVNASGAKIVAASEVSNPSGAATAGDDTQPSTVVTTGGQTGQPGQTGNPSQETASGTTGTNGAGTARVLAGGVTMPEAGAGVQDAVEKPKEEPVTEAAVPRKEGGQPSATGGGETARPAGDAVATNAADKGVASPAAGAAASATASGSAGVLERFRTHRGAQTPASLVALFDTSSRRGLRQEPAIALSDGVSKVKLSVEVSAAGKAAPSFAIDNATVVSVAREGASTWVVEALPAKGASSATMILLDNGTMTEIPLTVAPPLTKDAGLGTAGTLTEADFNRFLGERGTRQSPRFDLNRDGVRDYVDDFIFTANYIVAAERGPKVKAKEPK